MTTYDDMPVLETEDEVLEFVTRAQPGMAAEYACDRETTRLLVWQYAADGLVTLFKRRLVEGEPLQAILVRISKETARKLGPPVFEVEA